MTQFSMLPWATGVAGDGAAPYTQEQSNNFFRFFDVRNPASEGIALGVLNELAVSGSSSPLSVATGAAVCYGRYWNDSAVSLNVSTPGVGTTGGRVVLRCTWSTNQIRLAVKMSANGVATPPSVTQTFGTTWEISLATFTVTTGGVITLTDDRTFRKATFQVDTAAIQNNAVGDAQLRDSAALSVIGRPANSGGDPSDIAADTNDRVLARAGNVLAFQQVATGMVADNAVDDTKVGSRVPQFYRRKGGSSTNWSTAGGNNYTPGAVRMQAGVTAILSGNTFEYPVFPVAFSQPPIVIVTVQAPGVTVYIYDITSTSFGVSAFGTGGSGVNCSVHWLAIGPE